VAFSPKSLDLSDLSRRERQIMEIIYRQNQATAAEVLAQLADQPTNATVRKLLKILEQKGYLRHETGDKNCFTYYPTITHAKAQGSVLDQMKDTFFKGSAAQAAIALLKNSDADMSNAEQETIMQLIKSARKRGR